MRKITVHIVMGAPRNFSRGGQNHRQFKKSIRFRRAVQNNDPLSTRRRRKRNFLRFLRRFRLKYRKSMVRADGASEKFSVFCRTAEYDVIISNSRREASAPTPVASPVDAHGFREVL